MCFVTPRNSGGFASLQVCQCWMRIAVHSAPWGLGVNKIATGAKGFNLSCRSSKEIIITIRLEPRVVSLSRYGPLVKGIHILKLGWFWYIYIVVGCLTSFYSNYLFFFSFVFQHLMVLQESRTTDAGQILHIFSPFSKPLCLLFAMDLEWRIPSGSAVLHDPR